jgi:hypothetical protein
MGNLDIGKVIQTIRLQCKLMVVVNNYESILLELCLKVCDIYHCIPMAKLHLRTLISKPPI